MFKFKLSEQNKIMYYFCIAAYYFRYHKFQIYRIAILYQHVLAKYQTSDKKYLLLK